MKGILSTLVTSSFLASAVIAGTAINANAALVKGAVNCSISNLGGATACEGAFEGNDANQDLSGLFGVSTWTQWAKVDNDHGTNGGLTVAGGGQDGTWSIAGLTSPFMIVLKGGPSFSAYSMDGNTTSGSWNTSGLFKGNDKPGPGLSHFTVYVGPASPPTPVPEPLTILGSALALGFGGLFKKKYGQGN